MRRLKVYGWQGHRYECPPSANGSKQTREICAAPSIAQIMRDTGQTRADLFNICETGNDEEIAQAMSEPGTVWWAPLDARPYTWMKDRE